MDPVTVPAPTAPPAPKARTWIVDPTPGRGDFTLIQPAIDAAADGDTVVVREGEYRESLRLSKSIALLGEGGADQTVVASNEDAALRCYCKRGRVARLRIVVEAASDFRPAASAASVGVHVIAGLTEFEDCDFASNVDVGVFVSGRETFAILRRCAINTNAQDGVVGMDGAEVFMEDCAIWDNGETGIWMQSSGTSLVALRCNVEENASYGIFVGAGASAKIENCKVAQNKWDGLRIAGHSKADVSRSVITSNAHSGISASDVVSTGTFRNNDLRGNARGPWDIAEGTTIIDENNLT